MTEIKENQKENAEIIHVPKEIKLKLIENEKSISLLENSFREKSEIINKEKKESDNCWHSCNNTTKVARYILPGFVRKSIPVIGVDNEKIDKLVIHSRNLRQEQKSQNEKFLEKALLERSSDKLVVDFSLKQNPKYTLYEVKNRAIDEQNVIISGIKYNIDSYIHRHNEGNNTEGLARDKILIHNISSNLETLKDRHKFVFDGTNVNTQICAQFLFQPINRQSQELRNLDILHNVSPLMQEAFVSNDNKELVREFKSSTQDFIVSNLKNLSKSLTDYSLKLNEAKEEFKINKDSLIQKTKRQILEMN